METRDTFTHIIDYQKKEIGKRIEENNHLKGAMNRNINQNVDKIDELMQSLDRFKQEQNESRIKIEYSINDKIKNSDDNLINLETTQKDLVCYFDTASSNMIKEDKENLANYDILNYMVSSTLPTEVYDFQESIRNLREKTDEQIKEFKTIHESNCEQLNSISNNEMKLLNETNEFCEENGKLIRESIQKKDVQFNKIRDNLAIYGQQIEKTENSIEQELNNIFVFNTELQNTYKSELNLKEKHLAGLKRDLVKCDPTGNTPQKSAFDFPKEIKPITPYQKVLTRFLMNKKTLVLDDLENIVPEN